MHTRHRRMSSLPLTALVAVVMLAAACAGGDAGGVTSTTVERDTIGDTVVVRTIAGSIWGDSAHLVEELRIGELDGPDKYTFGQIRELAVGPQGTIYVYDGAVKALRAYDSTGRYLRTIGAEGGGPGEYREVLGLAVLPDGRLLLDDPRLGRINVYSATGDPLGAWPMPSGLFTSNSITTDSAGRSYVKILTSDIRQGEPWPIGYVRLDGTGAVVDTIPGPRWREEVANAPVYGPVGLWAWHPHGYMVAAFGGRYAVELRRVGQPVLRIERADQPMVPVPADERAELKETFSALRRQGAFGSGTPPAEPEIPAVKPALRALTLGDDGRIWVSPHLPSVRRAEPVDTTLPPGRRPRSWTAPVAWDVFEPDGTFLGRVTVPPGSSILAMRGDRAWGTVRDENDVPYVVRWRVKTGGDGVNR